MGMKKPNIVASGYNSVSQPLRTKTMQIQESNPFGRYAEPNINDNDSTFEL